jgi:hypothetical protein
MYSVDVAAEAEEQVAAFPAKLLAQYAELMVLLEVAPWSGAAYNRERPEANMRTRVFGDDGEAMAIYLVLEDQRRVSVVRVVWTG